jgi:hypothetical protein
MTPSAPDLPVIVSGAGGPLGFTAAWMLVSSAAMLIFMPSAVPAIVKGLTGPGASPKSMLMVILLLLLPGMAILRALQTLAIRLPAFHRQDDGRGHATPSGLECPRAR